jgi:hypothetical protein
MMTKLTDDERSHFLDETEDLAKKILKLNIEACKYQKTLMTNEEDLAVRDTTIGHLEYILNWYGG